MSDAEEDSKKQFSNWLQSVQSLEDAKASLGQYVLDVWTNRLIEWEKDVRTEIPTFLGCVADDKVKYLKNGYDCVCGHRCCVIILKQILSIQQNPGPGIVWKSSLCEKIWKNEFDFQAHRKSQTSGSENIPRLEAKNLNIVWRLLSASFQFLNTGSKKVTYEDIFNGCKEEHVWCIANMFMQRGKAKSIVQNTGPDDTDAAMFFRMMQNCKLFEIEDENHLYDDETGQFMIALVVLWLWFIMTVLLYGGLYSNTGADPPNGERCVSERSSGTQGNVLKPEETKEAKEVAKPPSESNKNLEDIDNYYRVDSTPEETGNLPFLENYRNPCWKELNLDRTGSLLRCLPYFFLVGAPKCGTTDLFKRLQLHPLVSTNVRKEQHWLTRKRFLLGIPKKICSPAVCKNQTQDRGQTLSNYLKYFEKAIDEDIAKTEENDYHPMIFGDCSASVFWDNQCLLCPFKDNIDATPPYTNADIVHNIVPNAKIMIMIRDPVKRLFSDYLYFRDTGKSVQTFHDEVVYSIKQHEKCLLKHSDRYCAYFMDASLRMQIGFYHIYIDDYLRVFPREQILIMRLEEYSTRLNESITEVFNFLEIGVPPEELMTQICEVRPAETKSLEDEKIGEMLPETFELLTEFYRPYNEKLVELLGDDFKY